MNVPICKRQRRGIDAKPEFKGSLPECTVRAGLMPGSDAALVFAVRWYRQQMRSWAGWWRDSFAFAAYSKSQEIRTAEMALNFAKMYRDSGREMAARIAKGAFR